MEQISRDLGPVFPFEEVEAIEGWIDLFTDGSCMCPDMPECGLSTWAIVSSTHGCTLSAGTVPGFSHSSDRAELVAMIGAMTWAQTHECPVACWTGSAYTAVGVWRLQDMVQDTPFDSNYCDLWETRASMLQQLPYPFCGSPYSWTL